MAQQRYHVIERIDAGGMAEVFLANSTSLQGFEKLVAIKRILPNLTKNERFVRMFLDEAKVSLHLNHTNCVQVFDLGLADGTYFIVMEYVDGVNLKHIIEETKRRGDSIPVQETAYICLEICKGLAHAHNKIDREGNALSIVHRDISPPNILISREGEVKITDFGLAKAKSQVETTDPGIVKGKFGYLSPEAAHGEEVDARTDIFAVGILMWELLAQDRLFLGETDIETLKQVRKNEIPPLAQYRNDVPPRLEEIIHKALATRASDRYQSIKMLGQDLASFLFEYGHPVTAFDIAERVSSARHVREKARPQRTERDKAVEEAVQQAVNQIVSLEEIEDLDMYLADVYDSLPDQGEGLDSSDGAFEDPRMWAGMGFEEADFALRANENDGGGAWQERNLDELRRKRRKSDVGAPLEPAGPDERTIEIGSASSVRKDAMRLAAQQNSARTRERQRDLAPDVPPPGRVLEDKGGSRRPPSGPRHPMTPPPRGHSTPPPQARMPPGMGPRPIQDVPGPRAAHAPQNPAAHAAPGSFEDDLEDEDPTRLDARPPGARAPAHAHPPHVAPREMPGPGPMAHLSSDGTPDDQSVHDELPKRNIMPFVLIGLGALIVLVLVLAAVAFLGDG